jgi:glucosylceramidase
VAFRNTDGSVALIVLNDAKRARKFSVRSAGESFDYALPSGAVATFVWTHNR